MKTNKKRNTKRLSGVVLAAALAFLAAGLYLQPTAAQSPSVDSTEKTAPLPTKTASASVEKIGPYKVADGQVIKELVLTGEMRAEHSVEIDAPFLRSSFANMITFLAPEGSHIKKGQRIVEFDDSSLLSQRSEAERTLDEAKLNIEKKKADLEAQRCDLLNSVAQAEADLEVAQLYGKISKDLLPGNTYQQYQLNLEKAKLSLEKANEQLDNFKKTYASEMSLVEINRSQAEINLKKIDSDMKLLKIDAPQDGILIYGDNWQSNRKMQEGDTAFPGREVARLPDLSSMQVVGDVYDTEYGSLATDMRCTITLDALPDFKVDGRIVSLTNVGSRKGFASEKKVFHVVVQPDKVPQEMMRPGMTARVKIPAVLAKNTPVVPREYISVDPQGRYFVYRGGDVKTASVEFVELGKVGDRMAQIVSGVSAGDSLLPIQQTAEVRK
jgi:multidrug efflux pump subunit AcrA (membrane-fusion protein)